MQIVLASASPRRRMLLETVGIPFTVDPSLAAEEPLQTLAPAEYARRLALDKAQAVAERHSRGLVLGADTIVVIDADVLGKPSDAAAAEQMLSRLNGRVHQVITGVALIDAATGRTVQEHEETSVWIRSLSREQIKHYVAGGEPMDKAGAYAIQGRGAMLVERIHGCYFNVVGLPLHRLCRMLEGFGFDPLG